MRNKLIILFAFLILLIISGCGFQYGIDPSLYPEITERIVIQKEKSKEKPFSYNQLNDSDYALTIPKLIDNACLNDEYLTVMVSSFDSDYLFITVGENCRDADKIAIQLMMSWNDIYTRMEVDLSRNLELFDLVNIYYSLPEGYIAEDYLDFLNYGHKMELEGTKATHE